MPFMSTSIENLERRRAYLLAVPAIAWTGLFFILPFLLMAAISFWQRTSSGLVRSWDLTNYAGFFGKPAFLEAALNSLEITITVTIASILLAYPLAWIIAEEIPERFRRLALVLTVIPFWTSYIVRSYAWSLVLSRNGVLNKWLDQAGLPLLDLSHSRTAVVIGFTHFFTMLLVLTIYSSLVQLPPNLRRAASDLGAGAIATFRFVVLPLTLPGVVVGAFLTFALCIGDYITPQILGGGNDLALPQLIMLQLGRRGDFPMASALSIVLMVLVTLAYMAMARWMREARS